MHLDVIDLREFYARPLGRIARLLIGRQIRRFWPNVTAETVAGLGYASPYLAAFLDEAERVINLMPAQQGVTHWPSGSASRTALVDETDLPLADESVNRMLLVHSVENSETLRAMLRQVWRVLAPGGRVLLVVPNRRGLWARVDTTPFGHGRPFSRPQVTQLLRDAMFSPAGWGVSLFVPPFNWRPLIRSAGAWERTGQFLGARFAGVLLVEASKQIYAVTPKFAMQRQTARLRVPALGVSLADPLSLETDRPSGPSSHPLQKGEPHR